MKGSTSEGLTFEHTLKPSWISFLVKNSQCESLDVDLGRLMLEVEIF